MENIKLNKLQIEDIKKLKKQKRYLEIFNRYGIKTFEKKLSILCRHKVRMDLIKKGDIDTLTELFDTSKVKESVTLMNQRDEFKKSKNKVVGAVRYTGKRTICGLPRKIAIRSLLTVSILIAAAYAEFDSIRNENITKNQELVDEYEDKVERYAQYINSLNLDDDEIIAKLVTDMWENIEGYGTPNIDVNGHNGVNMMSTDSVGVCRNMADDAVTKLNLINKDYNARVLVCYVDFDNKYITIMDNVRPKSKCPSTEETTEVEVNDNNKPNKKANHAVVAFEIPGEKYTFIYDPTNPALGIITKDGIIMFNSTFINGEPYENGAIYEYRPYEDFIINHDVFSNIFSMLTARSITEEELIELNNKYGIESQNELVKKINEIDDQEYVEENFYSKKRAK